MKCVICETSISIIDWLKSPGRKGGLCTACRKIYTEEEEKVNEQMYEKIEKRLEERKK